MSKDRPRSSRQRYRGFVEDYKQRRLDEAVDILEGKKKLEDDSSVVDGKGGGRRWSFRLPRGRQREYLKVYLRWLHPHRYAIASVFALALLRAGMEMIEPLFMRFIIDHVLLNRALDAAARLTRLNVVGATFLTVIIVSNLIGVLKDYRQRLLNVRVVMSLRRTLYERLLHLPLPKLWDMK